MARPIHGTLFVSSFNPTTPGEYTFTGGIYNNQSDVEGNGAFALTTGFLLYIPASDINTFSLIPGVFHRYVITALSIVDGSTIDATILWDEEGPEIDTVSNGSFCVISEPTPNRRLGAPISQGIYPNIGSGAAEAIASDDAKNILDGGATDVETKSNTSGVAIAQYDAVSEKSDGTIEKASTASASAEVFYGIALTAIPNNSSGLVKFAGEIKNAISGLSVSPETPVYVSATAGILSATAPTASGTLVMRAGYASGSIGQNLLIDKKKIVRN